MFFYGLEVFDLGKTNLEPGSKVHIKIMGLEPGCQD
jgi:hypothetical protein